jgi:carbonic anhydrase
MKTVTRDTQTSMPEKASKKSMREEANNVLIADDHEANRKLLAAQLELIGFNVVAAAIDGEEAIALYEEFKPDLVIMDIKMPKIDGIEAAKAMNSSKPVPVILVTGYSSESLVARAIESGVCAYIFKPVTKENLLPAIGLAMARFKELAELKAEVEDFKDAIETKKLKVKTKIMETMTKEMQEALTPQQAVQLLKDGNKRFVKNMKLNRNLEQQVSETSKGQYPFAVILSCIDSRTHVALIFDLGFGDVFNARVAGNIVNEDILGSMEYACKVAGSKALLVLGHTKCGAIKGACDDVKMGNLTVLLDKIKPAVNAEKTVKSHRDSHNYDFVEKVAALNVNLTTDLILKKSLILKEMAEKDEIAIIKGMYNVETGVVDFYEE